MYPQTMSVQGQYRQVAVNYPSREAPPQRHRKRERPTNNGSRLLSENENAIFYSMLGYDCFSLAAGVVQLLRTDPYKPSIWSRQFSGVVSLVKDYGKRAYFLRLYDVFKGEFKWQQMLYKNFRAFPTVCPNLLYFEGDECVFGLNFSSREECENFKTHLDRRYQQELKTGPKKVQDTPEGRRPRVVAGPAITPARPAPMASKTGITAMGTSQTVSGGQLMNLASTTKSKKKTKKEKKSKIRKEDISNPTNFQHKAHIGWDANGGFSQETYDAEPMDNSVRDLLKAAGENPDRMTKDELDFTYRFLNQYQKAPAPEMPPPVVQHQAQRPGYPQTAAPPPPLRRDASMPAKAIPPQRPPSMVRPPARPLPQAPSVPGMSAEAYRPSEMPPPPPAAIKEEGPAAAAPPAVCAAAPPPPPPPPMEAPAAAGARGDLLSEIRAGGALKPAGAPAAPAASAGSSRDDVMAQIRQGATLKPVDKTALETKKTTTPLEDVGGIAGALARALEERRKNMRDSEESEEEEEEANDSEWETD